MKVMNELVDPPVLVEPAEAEPLHSLIAGRSVEPAAPRGLTVVGELIGMTDDGRTPLVVFPGQPGSSALPARAVLDLHGAHVGKPVVLTFEAGDPAKPIVLGVVRDGRESALDSSPGCVELDADGTRLMVTAKDQLVLRCGKASITLTRTGKVVIQGEYVSTRSSGVIRIKGGSIQLN
jgi:hypothetical protein